MFSKGRTTIPSSTIRVGALRGSTAMAAPPLQTALTNDFPGTSTLTRSDLVSLIGTWDPSRPSAPWYQQPRPPGASAPPVPAEEQAFEGFIESLPEVKAMRQETEKLIRESEEKAGELGCEDLDSKLGVPRLSVVSDSCPPPLSPTKSARNTAIQPSLEALRAETQQLYDRARSLEQQWPRMEAAMREAYRRFTPSSLLFTLTQSASKLHDESESLANAFVEGVPLEIAVRETQGERRYFSTELTPSSSVHVAWPDSAR